MKFILSLIAGFGITHASCQYISDSMTSMSCSQVKAKMKAIEEDLKTIGEIKTIMDSYVKQGNSFITTASINRLIAKDKRDLDKIILDLEAKVDSENKFYSDRATLEYKKNSVELAYHSGLLEVYRDVRTRKEIYETVEASEIKTLPMKYFTEKLVKYIQFLNSDLSKMQARKTETQQKAVSLNCDLKSGKTIADEEKLELGAIEKLLGNWTEQPTPWGTAGGACQIIKEEGQLKLINENKNLSGATVSIDKSGAITITATDWPVTGKVSKDFKTIDWSNKSVWKK